MIVVEFLIKSKINNNENSKQRPKRIADLMEMSHPQLSEIPIKKQEAHYGMNVIKKAIVYLSVILDKSELPDYIGGYIYDQCRNNIDTDRPVNRRLTSI